MADKKKNIASFFLSKKWGLVVVGDKKSMSLFPYLNIPIPKENPHQKHDVGNG